MNLKFSLKKGKFILKVLSYWNLNDKYVIVDLKLVKLKVLSYWNLNTSPSNISKKNFSPLKVLSYWNLNISIIYF